MQVAADDKGSWLRSLFSKGQQQPQGPQTPGEAARAAEGLAAPGSIGDQIRRRREEADQLGKELSLAPQDMLLAQNDTGTRSDAYGGVSVQTRAALAKAGAEDPTGDLGDMMIGGGAAAPNQNVRLAQTTVRGPQTSRQEDQLVKMLIGRGMSEKEARARARSIR